MKMNKLSLAVLGASLAASSAYAAPTLKDVLGASGITVSGYVDGAYTNFDTDAGTGSTNYFDAPVTSTSSSNFSLKQASVTLASQPESGFGALVNLTAGSDADWIKSYPYATGPAANSLDVTQAFVQYAGGGFTVIGGKFNTLAGAEVIAPTGNTNISRSIAFLNALPFTHTGARVAYAPSKSLTFYAGVNNGWDQQQDMNEGKTGELGVSWTSDMVSAAVYGYYGNENVVPALSATATKRSLIDAVVTIKPIAPLAIVLNYDMGKQDKASAVTPGEDAEWTAINGYINYQFTDKFRTSLRLEQFEDKDGYKFGLGDEKVKEVTLTVGYAPVSAFELRGELRQDKADDPVFTKDGVATDKQNYFAVEGLYKF